VETNAMRALIVDDSRFIRDYLRSLLEKHGVECVEAENGQLALAAIEQGSYEVALVDMNMPVMGGIECVKALRGNPQMTPLKILMVTTEAENACMEAALDAGADEYLMKPFDDAALMDKLRMIGVVAG
jgi:two-component system chemotaxis response regulator CheY